MNQKIKDLTKQNYIYQIILYFIFSILFLALIALRQVLKEKNWIIFIAVLCSVIFFGLGLFKLIGLKRYLNLKEIKQGTITNIQYVKKGCLITIDEQESYTCFYRMASFMSREYRGLRCSFVIDQRGKAYIKTIFNEN